MPVESPAPPPLARRSPHTDVLDQTYYSYSYHPFSHPPPPPAAGYPTYHHPHYPPGPYTPWGAIDFTSAHLPPHQPPPPPPPQQSLPPQPVTHKVWILDCSTCRTFLTNRGMKAVLLLRPHVPLYSTDALPINCSAHGSLTSSHSGSSSAYPSSSSPSSSSSTTPPPPDDLPRTCECLTQTLCCHGCGNPVGYMIVIPCARCTASVAGTTRATNGHRFVFHSAEITAQERRYVPGESGVSTLYARGGREQQSRSFLDTATSSPVVRPESPGPPPLIPPDSPDMPPLIPVRAHRRNQPLSGEEQDDDYDVAEEEYYDREREREREPKLAVRKLRAGEVLFWHHLTRAGEIPGVYDDRRARARKTVAYDR